MSYHRRSLDSTHSYSFTSRHRRPAAKRHSEGGKVRPLVLLWALGVPLPLILLLFLIRGCVS